ncbi:MAG: ATP-binding cassette domain-containing protein [Helicobacteraceae bacterium]|nr:ATP-binding cassette domain-containing protein [Helicobacteraceae bacterium]
MSVEIKKLKVTFQEETLLDLSLSIDSALGMVGASGSGKSLTLKALLNLLPKAMTLTREIDAPFEFKRGETVAFIPQNPFTALSPMSKIGAQFHEERRRAAELLEVVGLAEWALDRFPSELSGGQLQRVIAAISLAKEPRLLLLDEPTTALDQESKRGILELFGAIRDRGADILFVSHDFSAVAAICDNLTVIDRGRIIESGAREEVLGAPKHDQTKALIASNFEKREWRV